MADTVGYKTSGQLAEEVEAQRTRVEATIGQIQERLSPGQMVDELLNYTKNGAGGEFVSNLTKSVSANPLPVALMGISLVWLMAKQGSAAAAPAAGLDMPMPPRSAVAGDRPDYRYATISVGLRRLGRTRGEDGRDYSEFVDNAGMKYRALTGAAGERAGDFVDEAGESFRGFKDAAGARVHDIRDQTGSAIDAASDWLSDMWDKANDGLKSAADSFSAGKDTAQHDVADAADRMGRQAKAAGNTLLGTLQDQPLVGGALAFAVGAAIAASLPHTRKEDDAFGEAADELKAEASQVVGEAYADGKKKVAETYQKATEKAGEIYDEIKSGDNAPAAPAILA